MRSISAFHSMLQEELIFAARETGDRRLAGVFEMRSTNDGRMFEIAWRDPPVSVLVDPSNPNQRLVAYKQAFEIYDREQLRAKQARNPIRRLQPRVRRSA